MTPFKYILNTLFAKRNFYVPEGMIVTGSVTSDIAGQISGIVNGDVVVGGNLVIFNNAVVNGNVQVDGRLGLLKGAVINGNVSAAQVETWGKITGFVQCSGKTVLGKDSLVKGNIRTAEIHMEKDAVLEGIVLKPDHSKIEENFDSVKIEDFPIIQAGEPKQTAIKKSEEKGKQNWF